MSASKRSVELAVRNVARWGDTDILPFPIENHWFHDAEGEVVRLILQLDQNFNQWLSDYPVKFERCLSGVGYVGYRGVTQIDPIWNAYLLALVIEVAPAIEKARIATGEERIFSYRFFPDQTSNSLFDRKIGWGAFQQSALDTSRQFSYVLSCDISDFYPRVYHHRVENALTHAAKMREETCRRIKVILSNLSIGGVSYGLPIGGSAARLLAEIVLNRTDRLLTTKRVPFCRFVDDYYIFANSLEEARKHLVYLSDILLRHEGLSLNRGKTHIMTREEFSRVSIAADSTAGESETQTQAHKFFKIRLKYDPYSPTAEDDYAKLRDELKNFDIVGMLAREFKKTRIDEALTKQLVKSLKFLDKRTQSAAVESLVSNLDILHPVFPTVSVILKSLLPSFAEDTAASVFAQIRAQIREQSHTFQVPTNLAFAIRLLADDPSEEASDLFAKIYSDTDNLLIRRDVILCMARRDVEYWLGDVIRSAVTTDLWLRRALIVGSFKLGDEGKHWRTRTQKTLHQVDKAFLKWAKKNDKNNSWKVPI